MRNAQYDRGYADAKEGLAPREPGKLYFEGYYAAIDDQKQIIKDHNAAIDQMKEAGDD